MLSALGTRLISLSQIQDSVEDMDVSENSGTPKSSILMGFSIINHPFLGTPIFGNTQISLTPVIWQK